MTRRAPGTPRRHFLRQLALTAPALVLPPALREALASAPAADRPGRLIESVDVIRVSGSAPRLVGVSQQFSVNPIHIYDERRPEPWRDEPEPREETGTLVHHYLRIRTRSGLEGLYGYVDPPAIPTLLGPLRRFLIGQDALEIERLWDQMYRLDRHGRAGHFMMATSAVDNALWDWRGRYFDTPVFRLLGGPTRNPVRVYGSCLGFSLEPDAVAERSASLRARGFDHQKWFFATGPGDGPGGLRSAVELVRILRESVGPDAELMFDAFSGWDLQFARQWAQAVEPLRPGWLEEPFPVADLQSFVRLSRETRVPVATGEHFYNRWEVQSFLERDAIQIVQADPEWCGGVSELVKICHLASTWGARVVPHGHNVHAALHVVASQSPAVCPFGEYLINHVPGKLHFQKDPLLTDDGWIRLPETPGFGIALDEAKVERLEVLPVA